MDQENTLILSLRIEVTQLRRTEVIETMNRTLPDVHHPQLTRGLLFLMALTCGFTVANVYVNQTLLASMAQTFGGTITQIGWVATLAQVGYALGNLFLVPLADMVERRRLMLVLLGIVSISIAAAAVSPNMNWLISIHLVIGITTVIPQVVVPMAASLVIAEQRGRVLGNVAIGLVCGILGARFVSGWIDAIYGWRVMYWISFGCMIGLMILVRSLFPRSYGRAEMTYRALIASLLPLIRKEQVLRKTCISQAFVFGAFSVFWTTLALLLASPAYSLGSGAVGMVGLVGIGGAFATPLVGRVIDRMGAVFAGRVCTAAALFSYLLLLLWGERLMVLVFAAFLITVGTQANQVACQARLFEQSSEARNRLNGLYMVATFLGGALGSYLVLLAWSHWQWGGVCVTGLSMLLISSIGLIDRGNSFGTSNG